MIRFSISTSLLCLLGNVAAWGGVDGPVLDAGSHEQCQRKCQAQAEEFVKRCVEAGGTERECAIAGRRFFEECSHQCNPDPPCRRLCEHRAKRFYRSCVHKGGTEDECAESARDFLEKCIEDRCIMTCEEKCANTAREEYNACIDAGGSEEDCLARAQEFFETCDAECTPGCDERCAALGNVAFHRCLEDGGSEEECSALRRRVVAECIEANCHRECGGILGVICSEGEFCRFRPGQCDIADNTGVCTNIPVVCPAYHRPVCGCDGVTYGNACEAAMASVSIDHAGRCEGSCGGIIGEPCPEGEFCWFPPGECEISDNQGRCYPFPELCLDVHEPVCGCDGITYGNDCAAAKAGVSIDHHGPCPD